MKFIHIKLLFPGRLCQAVLWPPLPNVTPCCNKTLHSNYSIWKTLLLKLMSNVYWKNICYFGRNFETFVPIEKVLVGQATMLKSPSRRVWGKLGSFSHNRAFKNSKSLFCHISGPLLTNMVPKHWEFHTFSEYNNGKCWQWNYNLHSFVKNSLVCKLHIDCIEPHFWFFQGLTLKFPLRFNIIFHHFQDLHLRMLINEYNNRCTIHLFSAGAQLRGPNRSLEGWRGGRLWDMLRPYPGILGIEKLATSALVRLVKPNLNCGNVTVTLVTTYH